MRFVKAVDLIDKEDRSSAVCSPPERRGGRDPADIRDRALYAAQPFKMTFCRRGDDLRQAGFSAAWRPVKNNRTQPVRFDRPTKQFAGSEDVLLAQIFVERPGTHPCGKGRVRIDAGLLRICGAKKIVHSPSLRGARGKSNAREKCSCPANT